MLILVSNKCDKEHSENIKVVENYTIMMGLLSCNFSSELEYTYLNLKHTIEKGIQELNKRSSNNLNEKVRSVKLENS